MASLLPVIRVSSRDEELSATVESELDELSFCATLLTASLGPAPCPRPLSTRMRSSHL